MGHDLLINLLAGLMGIMLGMVTILSYRKLRRFVRDESRQLKAKLTSPKIKPVLDKTKRKSLQPGSRPVPKGYLDPNVYVPTGPTVKPPRPETSTPKPRVPLDIDVLTDEEKNQLDGHFTHKFFGSRLLVGDREVIGSLSKGIHRIEITAEGRVFVDNVPFEFSVGDAMAVKRQLLKSRSS